MKHTSWLVLIALFVTLSSGCGRRTAPVPYQVPEAALPEVRFSDVSFRGDQLFVQWELRNRPENPSFSRIKFFELVFTEQVSCSICETKPDWGIRFVTEPAPLQGVWFNGDHEGIRFISRDHRYYAEIDTKLLKERGLGDIFRLKLKWNAENDLVSKASLSEIVTKANDIPIPKLSKVEMFSKSGSNSAQLAIQWELVPETTLQLISADGMIREKLIYYGVNLYRYEKSIEALYASPINQEVLRSGKVLIDGNPVNLYACFVDRFGNESKRVAVTPN